MRNRKPDEGRTDDFFHIESGESMRAHSITGISANMVQHKGGNPTFSLSHIVSSYTCLIGDRP